MLNLNVVFVIGITSPSHGTLSMWAALVVLPLRLCLISKALRTVSVSTNRKLLRSHPRNTAWTMSGGLTDTMGQSPNGTR